MILTELDERELNIFLRAVPQKILRDFYINIPKLAEELKGFRPNKADISVIISKSFHLIKRKNALLIRKLTDFYDKYLADTQAKIDELVEKGFGYSMAYAIVVTDNFSEEMRALYFKCEGISEKEQREVQENIALLRLIKREANGAFSSRVESEVNNQISALSDQLLSYEEKLHNHAKALEKSQETEGKLSKSLVELSEQVSKLTKEKAEEISLEKQILEIKKEINGLSSRLGNVVAKPDTISSERITKLEKSIETIENELELIRNESRDKCFVLENVVNEVFVEMDTNEELDEEIGDVISDISKNGKFVPFREYIKEALYSYKPILTSSKNAKTLTTILASIVTGGTYYTISVSDEYSFLKFREQFETITDKEESRVILIKGLINKFDYLPLIDFFKNANTFDKLVFEITFDAEIKFLPKQILEDFLFFSGNLDSNKIGYCYKIPLGKRSAISNGKYDEALDQIGIALEDKTIFNVKYFGLLAYSHIPFKCIQDDTDVHDAIKMILDPEIRAKCEGTIDV